MSDDPLVKWSWIVDHRGDIFERLVEHLELTVIAVVVGLLISFPLSVFAYRHKRAYTPIASVAGIIYTIPSLALFAFLLPYTGLTVTTAEIGLIGYTLLILIRNIVAGLSGVPADAKEAARGMGYSDRQLLWRVELPLALPVIVAGIRLATVTTIGLVTITALIGQGGLGFFIRLGFLRFDAVGSTAGIVGATLSMALAILVDGLLVLAEKRITPWARTSRVRAFG
jgi:osmoprotectant transport system permease protein